MYPSRFTITWGPSLWRFLHVISFTYPDNPSDEDKRNYSAFFSSLGGVIPCPACAVHYKKYTEEHPVDLDSRETLSRWVYDFHNHVSSRKPASERRSDTPPPSFEEVRRFYTNWDESRAKSMQSLSPAEMQQALGSPFMTTAEHQGATSVSNVVLFLFVAFVFVMLVYYLYRSNKQ